LHDILITTAWLPLTNWFIKLFFLISIKSAIYYVSGFTSFSPPKIPFCSWSQQMH